MVAGPSTYGCRLAHLWLQANPPTVAGPLPYGCRYVPGLPTEMLTKDNQLDKKSMRREFKVRVRARGRGRVRIRVRVRVRLYLSLTLTLTLTLPLTLSRAAPSR